MDFGGSPAFGCPGDDWTEFKRDLFVELFGGRPFRQGRYLFRGEGDADHVLSSYFDRRFAHVPTARRMALWGRLLALGQHYGLPTRLLDRSASPYVAALFAFHAHLVEPTATDRVAVWVLHLENPVWTSAPGAEVLQLPSGENSRQRRQNGSAGVRPSRWRDGRRRGVVDERPAGLSGRRRAGPVLRPRRPGSPVSVAVPV